ncbi:MAG: CRTAC1 family protein, partial [Acidobacteria bacterium]|nr:CRTAC1 family protein [Acidobacteriota bacterium]
MKTAGATFGTLTLLLAGGASGQPEIRFTEVAEASGVRFINMYGGVRAKDFILETTGTGAAFFDYDGDGDLDLFLVNGSRLGY